MASKGGGERGCAYDYDSGDFEEVAMRRWRGEDGFLGARGKWLEGKEAEREKVGKFVRSG